MRLLDMYKVRAGAIIHGASEGEVASLRIKAENGDGISVLVGTEDKSSSRVELEVAGGLSTCMSVGHSGELAWFTTGISSTIDTEHSDAIMAPIAHKDIIATGIHTDPSTCIEMTWEGRRDGADTLYQSEGTNITACLQGFGFGGIEFKHTDCTRELIDHIDGIELGVEADVPGGEGRK